MAASKQNAAAVLDPSGAIADEHVQSVDLSHPAVDDNPRANANADAVRIDFNDPTLTASEAVAKNLADQS